MGEVPEPRPLLDQAQIQSKLRTLEDMLRVPVETVLQVGWSGVKWPSNYNAAHLAATHGSVDAIDILATAKADFNAKDDWGRSALDYAVEQHRRQTEQAIKAHIAWAHSPVYANPQPVEAKPIGKPLDARPGIASEAVDAKASADSKAGSDVAVGSNVVPDATTIGASPRGIAQPSDAPMPPASSGKGKGRGRSRPRQSEAHLAPAPTDMGPASADSAAKGKGREARLEGLRATKSAPVANEAGNDSPVAKGKGRERWGEGRRAKTDSAPGAVADNSNAPSAVMAKAKSGPRRGRGRGRGAAPAGDAVVQMF